MTFKHVFQVVLVEKQRLYEQERKLEFEIPFFFEEVVFGWVFFEDLVPSAE